MLEAMPMFGVKLAAFSELEGLNDIELEISQAEPLAFIFSDRSIKSCRRSSLNKYSMVLHWSTMAQCSCSCRTQASLGRWGSGRVCSTTCSTSIWTAPSDTDAARASCSRRSSSTRSSPPPSTTRSSSSVRIRAVSSRLANYCSCVQYITSRLTTTHAFVHDRLYTGVPFFEGEGLRESWSQLRTHMPYVYKVHKAARLTRAVD